MNKYSIKTSQLTSKDWGRVLKHYAYAHPLVFLNAKVTSFSKSSYVSCTTGNSNWQEHAFAFGNLDFSPRLFIASMFCNDQLVSV